MKGDADHSGASSDDAEPRAAGRTGALRVLIDCNQALVHATDEGELLHDVCSLLVDSGGYAMA